MPTVVITESLLNQSCAVAPLSLTLKMSYIWQLVWLFDSAVAQLTSAS